MSRRAIEWARPQTWAARVKDEWVPRILRGAADGAGRR